MNQSSQFAFHPDAESLNAFAEQALPSEERDGILDHIAGCSRCRQIVYLAQEAAVEIEAPAPYASPATLPNPWFRNWRLAWAPAAAFAGILTLALVLHFRPAQPEPEQARVLPQESPAVSSHASEPRAEAASTQAQVRLAPAKSAPTETTSAPRPVPVTEPATQAAPAAGLQSAGDLPKLSSAAPGAIPPLSGQENTPQAAAAELKLEPAVSAWQQQRQMAVDALSTRAEFGARSAQEKMHGTADHVAASRSTSYGAPAGRMEAMSAPAGSLDLAAPVGRSGTLTVQKTVLVPLPSGLKLVSIAASQHLTLAIDQAGTLFLSEDPGRSWAPIASQWTGRAVEVRVQRTGGAYRAVAAVAQENGGEGSVAPSSAPVAVFEIVNDRHSIWTSVDGRTWKPR